ncbi:aspartate/glutamate racemase family protein [Pelagibius sp. CAU 1746]|uniref:aspartate/glutamate racemase family protein n=1 Tax=Pelagibius sp. CAU 1746 TaxID=3140370 RepID=UPI00325BD0A1
MRILLINPNTSSGVTARLHAAAANVAAPGTEIVPVTASKGVPYISTRAEEIVGGHAVLEILSEESTQADGAIIAAFGDPGLGGARELFDIPVVGLAEAGMATATMLGRNFSIVTFATSLGSWYQECVDWHKFSSRCVSIRALDKPFKSIDDVSEEKEDLLAELANTAVSEDGADVVVLAGAPLALLASRIRDRVPVPLVDCAEAAIKQMELLVTLKFRKAAAGNFRRPVAKSSLGLSASLSARLAHQDVS